MFVSRRDAKCLPPHIFTSKRALNGFSVHIRCLPIPFPFQFLLLFVPSAALINFDLVFFSFFCMGHGRSPPEKRLFHTWSTIFPYKNQVLGESVWTADTAVFFLQHSIPPIFTSPGPKMYSQKIAVPIHKSLRPLGDRDEIFRLKTSLFLPVFWET